MQTSPPNAHRFRPASLATCLGGVAAILAITPLSTEAFPPAPYHTVYGVVRDQNGQVLRLEGGAVVLFKGGKEVMRQPISSTVEFDQNYQIRLRMDMLRANTEQYNDLAHNAGQEFTVGIVINSVVHYPIEISTPPKVGHPGERVRLDLTLGVDSDGDGIPDPWEESQLHASGESPGEDGWDLSRLDRDGDFDGDGISNWNEYIAGTYAMDATDFLSLEIQETLPLSIRFQFFSIYGKEYVLESSTDMKTWSNTPFHLSDPDPEVADEVVEPQSSIQATSTGVVDVYAPFENAEPRFYRLTVR